MNGAVPVPGGAIRGLGALLDGRLAAAWKALEAPAPAPGTRILELRPEHRAVVSLPATAQSARRCLFLFADPEEARTFFRRSLEQVGDEGDVSLQREHAAVLWHHPFDPTLKALPALDDPGYLRFLIGDPDGSEPAPPGVRAELEEWWPEHHAALRVEGNGAGHAVRIQVHPGPEVEDRVRSYHALAERAEVDGRFRVPRLLRFLEARNLLVHECFDCTTLDRSDDPDCFEGVGRALARLHAADLPLHHRRAPPEDGDQVRRRTAELKLLAPALAPRLDRVGERLGEEICQLNLSPSAIVLDGVDATRIGWSHHGPVWLDPGAAVRGPAALDLGALQVSLAERPGAFAALARGYARAGCDLPPSPWIRAAAALHAFACMERPLLALAPDWPEALARGLDRVALLLERGP